MFQFAKMMVYMFFLLFSATMVNGDASSYEQNAVCTNDQLMRWYNDDLGLFVDDQGNPLWWNSANMISAFNDLASLDSDVKGTYSSIWANTYEKAPLSNAKPTRRKRMSTDNAESSPRSAKYASRRNMNVLRSKKDQQRDETGQHTAEKRQDAGFIGEYYDDEGWWGLAWLGAYDNTDTADYLNEAMAIWSDMNAGWNTGPCGGLPWYKGTNIAPNAIENGLFIQLSAALANHVSDANEKTTYINAAEEAWTWYQSVGLINSENLVNDGVDPSTCQNNGNPTYSYNQGVIIGGLTELYKATGTASYLDTAIAIANAVTTPGSSMLNSDGILVDQCDLTETCSGDGVQFKGVFLRNIKELQLMQSSTQYQSFVETNAQSIWNNDLNVTTGSVTACLIGVYWSGPYTTAESRSQSSALDCINAAIAVTA